MEPRSNNKTNHIFVIKQKDKWSFADYLIDQREQITRQITCYIYLVSRYLNYWNFNTIQ